MQTRLAAIRACVDCEYLGGPVLASGSTETCVFVEPRLRAWDLRPHVIRTRSVPKFTGELATRQVRTAPPGGRKPRWKPWHNLTREMLRMFARGIQDGVVDLPYEVRVRTKQGYPGVKTIEPAEPSDTRPSWSAHVARISVKAARAASDSARNSAASAETEWKAAKQRSRKRKRANKTFLKQFRR